MKNIIDLLQMLNFSKTEAAVYITLLKNSKLTGYQIAKELNISRSSVYAALDNLYKKGYVFLLKGDSQIYQPESPKVLMKKLKREYISSIDTLESQLSSIEISDKEERYINIEGYENIIEKTKEILLTAEKEVYINTDFDLQDFADEFKVLGKKGVRIIIFSFSKLNSEGLPVELYEHCDAGCLLKHTRIMLVVDCEKSLIADCGKSGENYIGTFTENSLMASIAAEHIHNDIYLLRLKNKYGKNLIDKDILIDSMLEKR